MGVEPGPGGGAAERDLGDLRQRVADAHGGQAHLCGVAGELLAQGDGHGIHQVRAAGLDDVMEGVGLGLEGGFELLERGQKLVGGAVQRGEMDRRGEHVVGGLPHVDVVIGVSLLRRLAVVGQRGDDLVGVHVR